MGRIPWDSQAKSDYSVHEGTLVEELEHKLLVEGASLAPAGVQEGWRKSS